MTEQATTPQPRPVGRQSVYHLDGLEIAFTTTKTGEVKAQGPAATNPAPQVKTTSALPPSMSAIWPLSIAAVAAAITAMAVWILLH